MSRMHFLRLSVISYVFILSVFAGAARAVSGDAQWLNVLSSERVELHYAPEIPRAEAAQFVGEYQRALDYLEKHYPLPYPSDRCRYTQYLVTDWRDFQLASFPTPGRARMYGASAALFVQDVYEAVLTPVTPRYLLFGLTQYLYDRYQNEDSHLRAAVLRKSVPGLSLSSLYRWDGGNWDPRLAAFFSASFLGYLEREYGWDQVLRFMERTTLPEGISRDLEAVFGVPAARIESGWLSHLGRQPIDPLPFDPGRAMRDWDRYQKTLKSVVNFRVSFDRGAMIAAYTKCRLLRGGTSDLAALEAALSRFEAVVRREKLLHALVPLLPAGLILIHVLGFWLRARKHRIRAQKTAQHRPIDEFFARLRAGADRSNGRPSVSIDRPIRP